MSDPVYTIGHSNRPLADFIALLKQQAIECLVDVRSYPGSRAYPHFNKESLEEEIPLAGMGYTHARALGGRRRKSFEHDSSPNTFWENAAFRNYADYALSEDFQEALAWLEALSQRHCCAVMCAEAVWWRCHRRIISDYLLARGIPVLHIMGDNKVTAASMTGGARPAGEGTGQLIYDGPR